MPETKNKSFEEISAIFARRALNPAATPGGYQEVDWKFYNLESVLAKYTLNNDVTLGGYQEVYENSIVEKPKNISVKYTLNHAGILEEWEKQTDRPKDLGHGLMDG